MNESFIRLFAPVNKDTAHLLFQAIDSKAKEGVEKLHILISSPGGSVFHGLSLYNYLRGLPVKINTYNFGSVDSIGVVLYCAGTRRYSVPHARFLIHGVSYGFDKPIRLEEKQFEEHLKRLRSDQENIARVIADTTGKTLEQIVSDTHDRITLNPEQAKDYGLVHEIKSDLIPQNTDLIIIGEK
jgi:ATP-dependent Clp protease, protease subunit